MGTGYYLYNAHGDVVNLTNPAGASYRTYSYDAFGKQKNPDSFDFNPFRYCGEYYDKESGNYYLRSRYYNPANGRFTQPDSHWNSANRIYGDNPQKINEHQDALGTTLYSYRPQISAIMQSGNLYAYCMNNPVNYLDTSGTIAIVDDVALILLACVAYGLAAYTTIELSIALGKSLNSLYPVTNTNLFPFAETAEASIDGAETKPNSIPDNPSIEGHIFRNEKGHIADTSENRDLLEGVSNDKRNFRGIDSYGNEWYSKDMPNGQQAWVEVRNGHIIDGGINDSPRPWNDKTGLKNPGGKK
jgi:RHS repeat-associated protein